MTGKGESPTNRNIPLPIKREVRRRCGFGCVVCGLPLYEYEHMEGWAKARRHVAKEITLLCDQHHKERTNGLLPVKAVREANANPHNLRRGVSKPYDLHFCGPEAEIEVGGNRFSATYKGYGTAIYPLMVDGVSLIGFMLGDEHLFLNLSVFDENNRLVILVNENELIFSIDPWDIQLVGKTLTVREAHKEILIELEFHPPGRVVVKRGRFLLNGVEILVRPKNILITNNATVLHGASMKDITGGLVVGEPRPVGVTAFFFDGVNRYLGDREAALRFERECLAKRT